MSTFCDTILPGKFKGTQDYLESFLIQFETASQINRWHESEKACWLIHCLEGPALSYIREITPLVHNINYDRLKHILVKMFKPSENCYKAVFYTRTLNENETLQAYGYDLKYLATKAYPNETLPFLEHIIVHQFIKGIGNISWSDHVSFHLPHTLEEAIAIVLGHKTFDDSHVCNENKSPYSLPRPKSGNLQAIRNNIKLHKCKPYRQNHVKTLCTERNLSGKAYQPNTLFVALQEHKQLQSSVSTEQHHVFDLLEVIVEVPKPVTQVAQQQQTFDYPQNKCSVDSDVMQVSTDVFSKETIHHGETGQRLSSQYSCNEINTSDQGIRNQIKSVSNEHCYQPVCLSEPSLKAVVILKSRVHDNSRGDYSPNIPTCFSHVSVKQLQSYFIRLQKRDFPD